MLVAGSIRDNLQLERTDVLDTVLASLQSNSDRTQKQWLDGL
jgi:hypothetical protein